MIQKHYVHTTNRSVQRLMMDYDNVLFNIRISSGRPHPGALLVAEPFLRDEHFSHAVICLVEYSPDSTAMGIVLNHPTPHRLKGLIEGVKRKEDIKVWCGGPMSCDRLYYVHTLGELLPGAREIIPGLYIGGDFEAMLDYVNSGCPIEGCIRFFVGYSGWSRYQLDEELRNHVWAVTEIPRLSSMLTGSANGYWHRHVRALGPAFRGWLYHPLNPQLN